MADIVVRGVSKSFDRGRVAAVSDVDLTVADGEFFVLLGPSGCGKTTLLRMIAGLEFADSGTVTIGQRDVTTLPPRQRDLAMVFQNYAVFPHLTVFQNIAFGLKMKHADARDDRRAGALGRRPGRAFRPAAAQARPAVRRPAAAGGGGARDRRRAVGPADGRAAVQPGRPAAAEVQVRPQADRARAEDDDDLRHARPGRGAQPRRPARRDARRADRPVRRAAAGVRASGEHVRRRVHRQPADELPAR